MRVRSPGFEPTIVAERSFDEHGLVVSTTDYRLTEGENGIVRELAEQITWTRDADGVMLGWHRTRPAEPAYRYQAQYSACPTR